MELFQQEIDSGKYPSGAPLTESEIEDVKNAVRGGKAASDTLSAEFRDLKVKLPQRYLRSRTRYRSGKPQSSVEIPGPRQHRWRCDCLFAERKNSDCGRSGGVSGALFGRRFSHRRSRHAEKGEGTRCGDLIPGHGCGVKGK